MSQAHQWKFFRAGGFDQVQLDDGTDLLALNELDQKLWVALSCPVHGIEFDEATLKMIDADGDGQVRANEVLAAVNWAGSLLRAPAALADGQDKIAPDEINVLNETGKVIEAAVCRLLLSLGKDDQQALSLADLSEAQAKLFAAPRNGDGVVCPDQIEAAALATLAQEVLDTVGGVPDRSGKLGINPSQLDRFFDEVRALAAWQAQAGAEVLPLGADTAAAAAALQAVRAKVDDYFTRCELAAFDTRAEVAMNGAETELQSLAPQVLDKGNDKLSALPLARVTPKAVLSLGEGLNPAWQVRMAEFRRLVVQPLLGARDTLGQDEWQALCARFDAWFAWQSAQPQTSVAKLGAERITALATGEQQKALQALIEEDQALAAEVEAIAAVERLLRYRRDLFKLANNFVSFRPFYSGREKASFQAGTLYLDGRSCELCIRVTDIGAHAAYANSSGICLVYCELARGSEKINIAAAFTAGDSDFLAVGRHGVFYDRKGQDWNATVVRIVDHPISIRQAFWSPYKKLSRMIGEQFQKFAASKAGGVEAKLAEGAASTSGAVTAGAAPKAPFDVAKFAGIFAAIGLAIGAIGGILASVVGGILSLAWWQIPLAVVGLMLAISLPSMALAWFKLRRRNLGPILDACGWAINARAKINIPFGASLTALPQLPAGAQRSLVDPYAEQKPVWPYVLLALAAGAGLLWAWNAGYFG